MDITVKMLPKSQASIDIVLSWDEWKKEMDHAVEHVAEGVKMPGFRPGKIPRDVLEKRYGKNVVVMEAAEHAVSHAYAKALKQEKIAAIGQPEVKLESVKEGEPLSFTLTTAVLPEVHIGDSWKKAVKKANEAHAKQVATLTVSPQEIDEELTRLASMRAKVVTVNRPAVLEDNVEVDFEVFVDGVLIEGGKSEKHPIVLGKGAFIPGFEEAIVGMQAGEKKTVTLSFPKEYHAAHLAGKPAEFQITLRLVQERQIPPIDDAFAQSLGSFESLEAFKNTLTEGMLEEKRQKAKEDGRTTLLDTLVTEIPFELPELLIDEERTRMIQEFQGQVESMGMSFDQYLEHAKKSVDDLKLEWTDQARKRLAAGLLLEQLAEDNALDVDSKDVEEAMNETLRRYRRVQDAEKNVDLERLYSATRGRLRNEKVFEMLEKL